MDKRFIYILDEKTPNSQINEQLEKTNPVTKEEVIELIISQIDYQDETEFDFFVKKYNRVSFTESSNQVKYDTFLNDLSNLEINHENLKTWNNPDELWSDLMKHLDNFHKIDEKSVLYKNQIQDWIKRANNWRLLYKKREFFKKELNSLKTLILQPLENKQASQENPLLQFVPEKWYALLHMILIQNGKADQILDTKDKNGIMRLGKNLYKFQGTGQVFHREIINIMTCEMSVYISNLSSKDRKIMKSVILDLSGNDADVLNFLRKLPN